jgi:hypothetical protein
VKGLYNYCVKRKRGPSMQIVNPHNKIVSLYALNIPEKSKEECKNLRAALVKKWELAKEDKVKESLIAELVGISRATYT